ncbi:MAG: hypothetical protein QOI53_3836, partial [Verrucomicrobiota bacterium]|nr:hypothetical protein [Verrucomicrobiota bacterium]
MTRLKKVEGARSANQLRRSREFDIWQRWNA